MVLLDRSFSRWLYSGFLLSCLCYDAALYSADQNVTSQDDTDTPGTLRYALNNIGDEGGTIFFSDPFPGPISLEAPLPSLISTGAVTVNQAGGDFITISAGPGSPIFYVGQGSVTMNNLSLQQGASIGGQGGEGSGSNSWGACGGGGGGGGLGAGGALFVDQDASVFLSNVSFLQNQAIGGQGGAGIVTSGSNAQGGGGGGGGAFYGTLSLGGSSLPCVDLLFGVYASGGGGGGGNTPGVNSVGLVLENGGAGGGLGGGSGGIGAFSSSSVGGSGMPGVGPFSGGGGGGAGININNSLRGGAGATGADFGGGGGAGGNLGAPNIGGGNGGFGGGGGGGAQSSNTLLSWGGSGGFGAGGGGGSGIGGYAGANGLGSGGGGGGAGLGGALFVRQGGMVSFEYLSDFCLAPDGTAFMGNAVVPGTGASPDPSLIGNAYGQDLFINSGAQVNFQIDYPITIASSIDSDPLNQGTTQITVQGSQPLTLLGSNTFDGTLAVTGGWIAINAPESLGVNHSGIASVILDAGMLQSVSPYSFALSSDLPVYIGDRGGQLIVPIDQVMVVPVPLQPLFSSSQIGGVTISGSGTTQFTTANTYGGTTTIGPSATLSINAYGALPPQTLLFESGTLNCPTALTLSQSLIGTGTLQLEPGVMLSLEGVNTYAGQTQIPAGATLAIPAASAISPYAQVLNDGQLLFTHDANVAAPSAINGMGSVLMNGEGTLLLSSANTYTAGTLINAGLVQIPGGTALSTGTATFNGGALEVVAPGSGVVVAPFFLLEDTTQVTIDAGVTASFLNQITGVGGLRVSGLGVLSLAGTSTYQGETQIDPGSTLQIAAPHALSSASSSIQDNGLLNLLTVAEQISQSITGSGNVTVSGTGTLILSGINTYGGTTTIAPGATLQLTNAQALPPFGPVVNSGLIDFSFPSGDVPNLIGGTGGVRISTGSSITLTGTNTYLGNTVIDAPQGELIIGTTGGLSPQTSVIDNGSLVFTHSTGSIAPTAISGSGSVTMDSPATLLLSGQNTFAGGLLLNQGTVQVPATAAMGSGTATFDGGTLELLSGFQGAFEAPFFLEVGGGTFQIDTGVTLTATSLFEGPGSLSFTGPGTAVLSGTNTYLGSTYIGIPTTLTLLDPLSVPPTSTMINQGLLQFDFPSGTVTNPISGSGRVTLLTGDVGYTGSKTYGGTTTIPAASTLTILSPSAFPISSPLEHDGLLVFEFPSSDDLCTLNGSIGGSGALMVDVGTLSLGGTNTYGGTTTISSQGRLYVTAPSGLPSGGTVLNEGHLVFQNILGEASPGAILGLGDVQMDGTGGQLLLLPSDTYEGGSYFNRGIVSISASAALGSSGLVFNGGALQLLNPFEGPMNATAVLNTGGGSILTQSGLTALYRGLITGEGPLLALGNGTLLLSGVNTYTNTTTVGANATLELLSEGALPSGSVVTDLGNLVFNIDQPSVTVSNLINGSGRVTLTGPAVFSLEQTDNSYSGGTIVGGGTLEVADFEALGSGLLTLLGGAECDVLAGSHTTALPLEVGPGGGSLLLESGASVAWSGDISSSTDAALTIAGPGAMTFSAQSSSLGTITLASDAQLTLSSATLLGPLDIENGSFVKGSATATDITNAGTLYPSDHSPLVLTGNYIQTTDGTFQAKIHGGGACSLLTMNGDATLAGSLDVIAPQGGYALGTQYVILNTPGTLSGTFDTINLPDFPQLLLSYSLDPQVILTVISQSILVGAHVHGHNPQQVLTNLQQIVHTPSSDLIHVIEAMSSFNEEQLTAALDQLHPAPFGAFDLVHLNTSAQITSILSSHGAESCCAHLDAPCHSTKTSVWVEPMGSLYHQDPIGEQLGFHATSAGLVAGVNYCTLSGVLMGIAGAYTSSHLNWDHHRGHGIMDSASVALYADYMYRGFSTELSLVAGLDHLHAVRKIDFSTIQRSAKHSSRGYDLTAHTGIAKDASCLGVTLRPFVDFDYFYLYQKGFTEEGADSLDLTVNGRHANLFRSELGLSATRSFRMGHHGCFAPTVWLSGVSECYLNKRHYVSRFVDETPDFAVRTWSHPFYFLSPGLDLSFLFSSGLSTALRYSAELNGSTTLQKLDARLEWFF